MSGQGIWTGRERERVFGFEERFKRELFTTFSPPAPPGPVISGFCTNSCVQEVTKEEADPRCSHVLTFASPSLSVCVKREKAIIRT